MCFFGTLVVGAGSIGNDVECKRFWEPLIGAFAVAMTVVLPYVSDTVTGGIYLDNVSLLLGLITCLYHLSHVATLLAPALLVNRPGLKQWLARSSVLAEMQIKRAAAHKLSVMTHNALDVVRVNDRENVIKTHFGQALYAYAKHGKTFESVGGFVWCWKRILSREAFAKPLRRMACGFQRDSLRVISHSISFRCTPCS
jgi:hypothetical protein